MSAGGPEARRPRWERTGTTRRIWQLAWPAILTNLLQSTVGLVGVGIVGRRLGPAAVAATGIGNRIFFFQQVVLMAVTAGTTALVARAWGAGDRDEAERVTRSSLWLSLALAVSLSLPCILFADALAGVFRLDAETHALTATFIRWISASAPFLAVSFVIGTALRAAGDTLTPLGLGALTLLVNVVALYALVFGAFGLPALGVAGAAIANDVALAVGALATAALWLRGRLRGGRRAAGRRLRARPRTAPAAHRRARRPRAGRLPARLHDLHLDRRAVRQRRECRLPDRRTDPVVLVPGGLRLLDRRLHAGRPEPRRERSGRRRAQRLARDVAVGGRDGRVRHARSSCSPSRSRAS